MDRDKEKSRIQILVTHYTIIIYHSTIVLKNFGKWLWSIPLFGKVAGSGNVNSLKGNSSTGISLNFLVTTVEQLYDSRTTVEDAFFKTLIIFRTYFGGKFCYCSSTY